MIDANPMPLERALVTLRRGKEFSQALLELVPAFALCAAVVGAVWYFLHA
jgi:hypothetical protein